MDTTDPTAPDRLEDLPRRYTRALSARRFDHWRALFTREARVVRVGTRGETGALGIDDAVRLYARHAARCAVFDETWHDVEIRRDGRLAQVRARYRLVSDREQREGVDLLTAVRDGERWRIASLVYEQTGYARVATPPRFDNLADHLTHRAELHPHAVAIDLPGGSLTFAQLDRLVWRCATRLRDAGLRAGDPLALSLRDPVMALVASIATARLGATVCWLPPSAAAPMRARLLGDVGAAAVIVDQPGNGPAMPRQILLAPQALLDHGAPEDPTVRETSPTAPWMVIVGSGTTGRPRRIPISHLRYQAQMRAYADALAVVPGDRVASLMSMDSVVARERLMDALFCGACAVLGRGRAEDGLDWAHRREVSLLWATVVHAEELLARDRAARPTAASRLRAFVVGSSTVSESLRRRIVEGLTDRLFVYYGTNEVGLATMAGPGEVLDSPLTVGRPAPGVRIAVVDPQGRQVPPGGIGEVRITSPGAADGYLGDPDASARAFRDAGFHPGDLGRLTPDGRLDYCGRADHLMIVEGTNVYPAEIEAVLAAHPAVRDAAAVPLRDPVRQDVPVCAVALHAPGTATEPELLDWAAQRLGPRQPRRVVILDVIPRNAQGKLQRAALDDAMRPALRRPIGDGR